jgi:hypothetical protein
MSTSVTLQKAPSADFILRTFMQLAASEFTSVAHIFPDEAVAVNFTATLAVEAVTSRGLSEKLFEVMAEGTDTLRILCKDPSLSASGSTSSTYTKAW